MTVESVSREEERSELQAVLESRLFSRSPTLAHLLSYLCEKTFAGESAQIKEYSVAIDVFDRRDTFDQDSDSIVRVQANRLRKRLSEYYSSEGATHPVQISIPVGQYVPLFERRASAPSGSPQSGSAEEANDQAKKQLARRNRLIWLGGASILLILAGGAAFLAHQRSTRQYAVTQPSHQAPPAPAEPSVGLPVGEEVRILCGSTHKYVDHAGQLWSPDAYFTGGTAVASSVLHIWRTQDPIIYRSSRQGDFAYNIPLKQGTYELHLHFAETYYGPESAGGGGEGSRIMSVRVNGQPLLNDFDVLADSGGDRTAEVKVFPGITPADDGQLHLSFSGVKGGSSMVSAIEILPGMHRQARPVRIVARDVPYYSDDSRWWSPDTYFKGGQLSTSQQPAAGTDEPEFYETERWGHFSYAIPVPPGRYTVTFYFIEHHAGAAGGPDGAVVPAGASATPPNERVFNVFCNGTTILPNLNLMEEAGDNHPLMRKVKGLQPNAQGKLLLEFAPVTRYATVSAIEVVPE